MAFGFSVGDFLAVGKLIFDVGMSLRDVDGSATQYQELQRELDSLQRALQCIWAISPQGAHNPIVEEIKQAVAKCQLPLQDFLKKNQGYEASLGAGRSKGKLLDWKDKAQWTISKKELDVMNLRAVLAAHTGSINMMLSRYELEMLETSAHQTVANHRSIEYKLDRIQIAIEAHTKVITEQRVHIEPIESRFAQFLGLLKGFTDIAVKFLYSYQSQAKCEPKPDLRFTWLQPPVTFEDPFGRRIPIPAEYDYEMVSALIKATFRDCSERWLVDSNVYELFSCKGTECSITQENRMTDWTTFLPGAYVKMAFIFDVVGVTSADEERWTIPASLPQCYMRQG